MMRGSFSMALLAVMLMATAEADWLDGGYVSSGGGGEVSQYFADPIFTSPSPGYRSSDPAIRDMQSSMDRSLATGASRANNAYNAAPSASNASGRWSLTLSQGCVVNLQLYQSGSRVFGPGSITYNQINKTYPALASGTVSNSSMQIDVVSRNGTELYSMIFDLERLHISSGYMVYRPGIQPQSGTARAFRIP